MQTKEDRDFELLKQQVLKFGGLDCQYYKTNYLKRRLAVRMRATGITDYGEYRVYLQNDPAEYDRLLDRLTINVSQFFRDPGAFGVLERVVLPELFKKHRIRVWSAGCAAGEEPYTLAILFKTNQPLGRRVDILATDIDPAVLERAREARYKDISLANMPPRFKLRFLQAVGEQWVLSDEIKRMVTFARGDLTSQLPEGPFDLIVCRNILIYFTRELQEHLFRAFHRILAPGGYLMLGKTEVLLAEVRCLYTIIDVGERIYRRREPEESSPETAESGAPPSA